MKKQLILAFVFAFFIPSKTKAQCSEIINPLVSITMYITAGATANTIAALVYHMYETKCLSRTLPEYSPFSGIEDSQQDSDFITSTSQRHPLFFKATTVLYGIAMISGSIALSAMSLCHS